MSEPLNFDGHFVLNSKPPKETLIHAMQLLHGRSFKEKIDVLPGKPPTPALSPECHWILTIPTNKKPDQNYTIAWDRKKHFPKAEEWLDIIIESILKPNENSITGMVFWMNETDNQNGAISVVNNSKEVYYNTSKTMAQKAHNSRVSVLSKHSDAIRSIQEKAKEVEQKQKQPPPSVAIKISKPFVSPKKMETESARPKTKSSSSSSSKSTKNEKSTTKKIVSKPIKIQDFVEDDPISESDDEDEKKKKKKSSSKKRKTLEKSEINEKPPTKINLKNVKIIRANVLDEDEYDDEPRQEEEEDQQEEENDDESEKQNNNVKNIILENGEQDIDDLFDSPPPENEIKTVDKTKPKASQIDKPKSDNEKKSKTEEIVTEKQNKKEVAEKRKEPETNKAKPVETKSDIEKSPKKQKIENVSISKKEETSKVDKSKTKTPLFLEEAPVLERKKKSSKEDDDVDESPNNKKKQKPTKLDEDDVRDFAAELKKLVKKLGAKYGFSETSISGKFGPFGYTGRINCQMTQDDMLQIAKRDWDNNAPKFGFSKDHLGKKFVEKNGIDEDTYIIVGWSNKTKNGKGGFRHILVQNEEGGKVFQKSDNEVKKCLGISSSSKKAK